LNLTIARSSKTIAVSSKRDSSAMKSLALLTMVFLPGTAVAVRAYNRLVAVTDIEQSFFAMLFFNETVDVTGNAFLETRPQFWIYWVVTIPLTLSVLGLWIIWLRITARRHEKEDEEALEPNKKGD
jgi:flagellar biosynthesis/type III secretory pathway M-ring protein FliF/YscJ